MIYLYTLILFITFPSFAPSSPKQFNFKCVIDNELEDGALPQKEIYQDKSLKLYLDIDNNW